MDPTVAAGACVALGFVLVLIEVFLIPGIGFAGVLGAVLIVIGAGVVGHEYGAPAGLATLMSAGALSSLVVWGFWRSGAAKRFVLESRLDSDDASDATQAELVGRGGIALTNLRPSGQAQIDDVRYDVVTEGEFIDRDAPVRVVEVEGFRVVVEAEEKNG